MTAKFTSVFLAGWMALILSAGAQDDQLTKAQIEELAKNLHYQQGQIKIQDGLATLNVPTNFYYLDPQDAKTVLVKFWGNPPSMVDKTLGLLMPSDKNPLKSGCWVVTMSYVNDGYVKDTDASKINYDDLLKQMQKGTEENNKARQEKGYPTVQLIGWASPPHYDAATHKLYWAKEVKFEDQDENELNYDIRILGRRGVLVLTAVSRMSQLPEIENQTPAILGMVDFNQGNRYADFDPKIDKVATYGIAALVAGGIAAKLGLFSGLFKLVLAFLVAAKKLVIICVVAIAAFFKKLFGRNKTSPPTA
jgi:uncharacterized membrane-anchored protein